jgi:hypothetical protein
MMSSQNPLDPIDGVGSVQAPMPINGAQNTDAQSSVQGIPQIDVRVTNIIFSVIALTNLAMDRQSDIVATQSKIADITNQMQSAFSSINAFLEKIMAQTKEASFFSGGNQQGMWPNGPMMNPNALSGLDCKFYALDDNPGQYADGSKWYDPDAQFYGSAWNGNNDFGRDSGSGFVSQSYQESMESFVTAVRSLFSCSATGTTDTVGQASIITNPQGGPDFNLNAAGGFWSHLNKAYSQYSYNGHQVFSTQDTDHMSLLQEYAALKMKLSILTGDKDTVTTAAQTGDYSKLANFDPASDNADLMVGPAVQFLNSLNLTVTADREYNSYTSYNVHYAGDHKTTRNILSMIMTDTKDPSGRNVEGDLYTSGLHPCPPPPSPYDPSPETQGPYVPYQDGYTGGQVGLFGSFAYAALNYAGTKMPNEGDKTDPNSKNGSGNFVQGGFPWDPSERGAEGEINIAKNGDPLSGMSATTNTAQTNISSVNNQQSTDTQLTINTIQQIDGTGGKIIDSLTSSLKQLLDAMASGLH